MKINGQEIPNSAVEHELNRLIQFQLEHGVTEQQIRANLQQLKERAVEQTIGTALLFQEADRLDLSIPEEEIDAKIADMEAQVGGHEKLLEILKKQGANIVEFRNNLKRGAKVDKLVEKITSDVKDPSEKDAEDYFNANREEFRSSEQVLAQHILVTPKSKDPSDDLEALAKIRKIRERIEAGSDFATEAATHSDCPSGKQAGGSLGWFSRGMMVKEFDEAAFSLPVGGLSDIIKTQFGYHIIYKNDAQAEGIPEFSEVVESIRDMLRHVNRSQAISAYVDELRKNAKIEK